MLVKAWLTWRDRDAALLIVEQFESAFLVKHFEKLASDLDAGAGIPRLFRRVASGWPSALRQLRQYDGITYAYVCARRSNAISLIEAKKLLNEYRDDPRLGILAWSLGKFGHWNLLVDLSDEVEDIERKQQKEQYKRMGLSSELVRSLTERGYNGAHMRLQTDLRTRSLCSLVSSAQPWR